MTDGPISPSCDATTAKKHSTCSSTHPVDGIDPAHCTDFGRVIDEADVSLRGGVKLPDFNVTKAIQKLFPNVCSDPVADRYSHSVVLLIFFLQRVTAADGQNKDLQSFKSSVVTIFD